jgi:hypothetical protein
MKRRHDFATRLRLTHAMIARGAPSPAGHVADQLGAASRDTRVLHDRLGAVLPLLAPDRNWRQRLDTSPSDDVRAYLLAAVHDCTAVCCHLKRGGPQPAIIRLPLRRVDCGRCVQTLRRPPAGEDDRCDLCGARGVVMFVPFACRQGPALIAGDVCTACAGLLGVPQRVGA